MISSEISQQRNKDLDISHLIEQVWISELLWRNISNSLDVSTSAFTVLTDSWVPNHFALLALQILHLIRNESSVGHIKKSLFNIELIDLMAADRILTSPVTSDDVILVNSLFSWFNNVFIVDKSISTKIDVRAFLALLANHIWDHQDQGWLDTFLCFWRELFAVDHPQ